MGWRKGAGGKPLKAAGGRPATPCCDPCSLGFWTFFVCLQKCSDTLGGAGTPFICKTEVYEQTGPGDLGFESSPCGTGCNDVSIRGCMDPVAGLTNFGFAQSSSWTLFDTTNLAVFSPSFRSQTWKAWFWLERNSPTSSSAPAALPPAALPLPHC